MIRITNDENINRDELLFYCSNTIGRLKITTKKGNIFTGYFDNFSDNCMFVLKDGTHIHLKDVESIDRVEEPGDALLRATQIITGSTKTDFIIQGGRYLEQQGYTSASAICEDVYNSSLSLDENMNILRSMY